MSSLVSFKTGTFAKHRHSGMICFILGQNKSIYDLLWDTNTNDWDKKLFKEEFIQTVKSFSIEKALQAAHLHKYNNLDNLDYIELYAKWKDHEHFFK